MRYSRNNTRYFGMVLWRHITKRPVALSSKAAGIYVNLSIMNTVSTYKGKIENGKIKLSLKVNLPENAEVFVIVPESRPKFDLAEMVKRMPSDYIAHEEDFGKPEGKEFW